MPLDFPNSPVDGQIYENYIWNATDSVWQRSGRTFEFENFVPFDFLVIGGGGGGGREGGGGGAGGYRCSVSGEQSGGAVAAEPTLFLQPGTHTVTVGAGGAASTSNLFRGDSGGDSVFATIVGAGGGGGPSISTPAASGGGSGAGTYGLNFNAKGITGQGTQGGIGATDFATFSVGAGGGGAGQAGQDGNGVTKNGGAGGNGLSSSITGSAVTRGGGGGGSNASGGSGGAGGSGGGGAAGAPGVAGTVNTGGGGGSGTIGQNGGNGGSGLVVVKYPDSITLSVAGTLVSSTATSGGFKVTTFTSGTGTVTF